MRFRFPSLFFLVFLALALGITPSCGPSKRKSKIIKECVLPEEQNGTMLGHWSTTPVPLKLHLGASFTETEKDEIAKATETWNAFSDASKGFPFLVYDRGTSSVAKPADFCDVAISEFVQNGVFTSNVVLYKVSSGWTGGSGAIALTTLCTSLVNTTDTYRTALRAGMQLNYQNFFVTNRIPDMQSILLHELGHLMGIGHSCESGGGTGIPDCGAPGTKHDYLIATMFPVFEFPDGVNGERKRELQPNDMGRVNCLY